MKASAHQPPHGPPSPLGTGREPRRSGGGLGAGLDQSKKHSNNPDSNTHTHTHRREGEVRLLQRRFLPWVIEMKFSSTSLPPHTHTHTNTQLSGRTHTLGVNRVCVCVCALCHWVPLPPFFLSPLLQIPVYPPPPSVSQQQLNTLTYFQAII